MTKLLIKTTVFTLVLSAITLVSKAQLGYDYAQYDIGFGASLNQVYGDAETVKTKPAAHVNFTYNQTPFVNYVVEIQAGTLEGGDAINTLSGRFFKNNFTALVFRGQLQAGELIDYSQGGVMNVLKNFYVSTGLGYILNDIKNDAQHYNNLSNTNPQYTTKGLTKSNELYLPARLGYEFKLFNQYGQPSFKVDVGAQYNMDFTDNMDGFDAGRSNDKMIQYSITLKFALGGVTSYRKQVN
ncbi:MAG: hypothetical protein V4456_02465 [Bacteroidota bacterium]